jgi:peptidoglycan/LPS O-acetylase OafA/YrhL
MQIKYRSDIDGLRALAVLSVLFYHLDFSLFSGGFSGVDVFFVISGYLITSIIAKELDTGQFSFSAFYERRIRRILPAYFFLLISTTLASFLIYTPETMVQYGRAMRYTLVFISNLLFAREVNYFDTSFNNSPLLHTWTLSVEEQFYLIWPVILVLSWKYLSRRKFSPLLIFLLISSFIASEILLFTLPKLSFYMLYSRAWEFGAGALLALSIFPRIHSKKSLELFSFLGFILLCVSFMGLDDTTRFPGFYATFSVAGTALIIFTGQGHHTSYVHRFLSCKPFVSIGLISYSLYLWHWPIITYTKYYLSRNLLLYESFFIILASIFIATLSYKYIEKPLRKTKNSVGNTKKKPSKKIFIFVAVIIISFVKLATTIEKTGGFPWRFPEIQQTDLYSVNPLRKHCHISQSETTPENKETCSRNYGNKKAIIWGDSHADHYSLALDDWARKENITLRQITKSACVPLAGDFDIYLLKENKHYEKYTSCRAFNENILHLIDNDAIDIVVIAGRWSGYLPEDTELGLYLLDGTRATPSQANTEAIFKENFSQMVNQLVRKQKEVILLGQVPLFTQNPAECFYKDITPIRKYLQSASDTDSHCDVTRVVAEREVEKANSFFRQLAKQDGVQFFDPLDQICDENTCSALQKGKILYRDRNHLNNAGSVFLKKSLAEKIAVNHD